MTQYDPEFEAFWNHFPARADTTLKQMVYLGWEAARAPQQPEVKPLELEGGEWLIDACGVIHQLRDGDSEFTGKGRARKTRELAEAAADKMRKRDRLHAFATEFMEKEYEFKAGEENYITGFSNNQNKWVFDEWNEEEIVGAIYMTKECAEYLCAALNDGRLVL
jgi:hypothetical protein